MSSTVDTSDNVDLRKLPPCTFAVMVQRLYADRVCDAMLGEAREWISLDAADSSSLEDHNNSIQQSSKEPSNCRIISTRDEPGVRKARRGYNLLILENCCSNDCLRALSPLARQKISWGAPLSHEVSEKEGQLGMYIWKTIKEVGFDLKVDLLRVDTFPKEMSERLCLDLQNAAAKSSLRDSGCTKVSSPYEGPIFMTRSASKCTHVLTVICIKENTFVWGIMDQSSFASLRFNDAAAQEVVVEPTHPNTGHDLSLNHSISPDVPVSRAYYKLTQVWNDVLKTENLPIEGCIGLDLGASPGGWTQVLRHHVGLSRVLAVDPGILATRVSRLDGVEHFMAGLASPKTASAIESLIASPQNKCCLLVCDASLDSYLLLDEIFKLLEQLDGDNKDTFSLPAAMVITLKLPYKTKGSLERNLQKVLVTTPSQLRRMARLMYSVQVRVRYQILHLMANSDSERTLVVVFDNKA